MKGKRDKGKVKKIRNRKGWQKKKKSEGNQQRSIL